MIITNDEVALRVKCVPVLSEEIGELVALLERELEHSAKLGRSGIGLAAIQIGIPKQIAIVRISKDYSFNLINCHIENAYDLERFTDEGCLSFPGKVEDTMRYQEIHIVDNATHPNGMILQGLPAVVAQHELDHINGRLLIDAAIPKLIAKKPRPNDLCDCGKMKKAKRCCYIERKKG
jgi:peptide deformylase